LNLQVPQERGWISPTKQDPNVQSLQPVLDAGVLVVAAGGNSRAHNNLHPKSYFVIGGYNDKGTSNERNYALHPSVASGLNGDGHWRPDLIAPYTYLPLPGLSGKGIDYFAGTCGTSTMVTGLIAQIWSQMPDITPNEIRNTLIDTGDVLDGFPAPIVDGAKAIRFLESGQQRNNPILTDPVVQITDENHSITSDNPLERALALTLLIKKGKLTREQIWEYATNESPMAKKVAIQGLGSPTDDIEREKIWERVHLESSDFGVREAWAYMLLETTTKEELSKWIDLVQYPSIDIQICINLFVQRYYPDAPGIEPLPDPDLEVMKATAAPLLAWYKNYQVCS
jgi:serine protease AprX